MNWGQTVTVEDLNARHGGSPWRLGARGLRVGWPAPSGADAAPPEAGIQPAPGECRLVARWVPAVDAAGGHRMEMTWGYEWGPLSSPR